MPSVRSLVFLKSGTCNAWYLHRNSPQQKPRSCRPFIYHDGASAFPAILLWLAGGVRWEVAAAGRAAAGAGHWRGPPPAAWRGAAVLLPPWPPSLGWLELVRGVGACRAVGGGLRSGAALVDVRLDVVPLPSRSSSPTVTGCRLGRYPAGRDWWGGDRDVGGVLPRINIGPDVWGESSIMTGVY